MEVDKAWNQQTFDLFGAWLQFIVVTDDPCILTVTAVMRARWLFDAVHQRTLLTATLQVVRMDGPRPFPEVCHHAGLGHPSVEDWKVSHAVLYTTSQWNASWKTEKDHIEIPKA